MKTLKDNKKILIYIGMGRCGSSSLQHAFRISRPKLETKGIFYPETNPYHDAQHALGFLRKDQFRDAMEQWENVLGEFEASGYTTMLVSTELFIGISDELFAAIRSVLEKYSVEVVFLTKNQRELLPSIYAQWRKAGIIFRSFRHFFQVTKQEWHCTRILERWSDAYGIENVRCGAIRSGEDAIRVFASCCGDKDLGEILSQVNQPRINASIHPHLLSLITLFDRFNSRNMVGDVFPGWDRIEPKAPDRNEFLRNKLVQALERRSGKWFRNSRWNLPQKIIQEIDGEYRETNAEFHSLYLSGESRDWIKG